MSPLQQWVKRTERTQPTTKKQENQLTKTAFFCFGPAKHCCMLPITFINTHHWKHH